MNIELIKTDDALFDYNRSSLIKTADADLNNIKDFGDVSFSLQEVSSNENVSRFLRRKTEGPAGDNIEYCAIGHETSLEVRVIAEKIYTSFISDSIELGHESKTAILIDELIRNYGSEFIDLALTKLMQIYIINSGKSLVMCKFITLLTEIDVKFIPTTSAYALTSFAHKKYNSVKEMILIAIELWKNKDALILLEEMEPYSRKYLEKYRLEIIEILKRS
ncbi:hypothetical protein [Klebsiella michiganensis]|uniref:hypothetical protein n=1 Tax=Klebsiella michiganensis TaxID=1134687 RepID=UPI0016438FBD|nr:hypothetical protein [Klebsiella michiganensis]MBC3631657.1 hypothetical protein [Klebsiella michiganensis]